jgi:multicomponent Na+:H+ antiporter subunit D
VPFHFWMADAYAVAPTSICLLFAGAMSELGLYGVARVYWTAFAGPLGPHAEELRDVLLVLGIATALLGGLMCAAQRHLKRLVAFATIAHMGILLCGIALLGHAALAGVAVFVVGDGLVKASLFVSVGALEHRRGSVDEAALFGRGRDLPALGIVFAIAGLALAALPPFGPFLGRAMIEDAATKEGLGWLAPVLVVASALVGGGVLRVVRTVFLGRGPVPPRHPACREADEDESELERARSPWATIATGATLLALGLAWGLVPGLVDAATAVAARFTDPTGYAASVLRGATGGAPARAGEGPTAAAWLSGLASGTLAVGFALLRTMPEGPLRAVHSGRIGDYVAWTAVGAAAIAAVFAVTLV